MAKSNWETMFEGELKVKIRGIGDFMVELVKDNLALYFAQAYVVLGSKNYLRSRNRKRLGNRELFS